VYFIIRQQSHLIICCGNYVFLGVFLYFLGVAGVSIGILLLGRYCRECAILFAGLKSVLSLIGNAHSNLWFLRQLAHTSDTTIVLDAYWLHSVRMYSVTTHAAGSAVGGLPTLVIVDRIIISAGSI
jgi:hypothetical protein